MPSLDAIVASSERHTIDGRIILPEISKKKKKTTLDLVSYSYGLNTSRETLWLHTSQISSLTHSTECHPHNVIHDLEVVQTGQLSLSMAYRLNAFTGTFKFDPRVETRQV